jgi:HlyD family secretion protein
MRKLIFLGVVAILIGTAVYWQSRKDILVVPLHTLELGTVEDTVANTRAGTIRACQRSKLSMPTGGTVEELLVSAGDHVEKGQVLLRLRDQEYQAAVQQASAHLKVTQQQRQEICFGAERKMRDQRRLETLAARKLASEEALDMATTEAAMSALSCKAANAQIEEAAALLKISEVNLHRTRLTAPFAGVVAEINGEIGEYITPSPPGVATPPAVDLIDNSCLYVRAPVDEVDTARIKTGMEARVSLDAFRGISMLAVVSRVAPYVQDFEKQARTVDIEVRISKVPDNLNLLVGYSADIEVVLERHDNVLRLPTEMILEGNSVLRYQPTEGVLQKTIFKAGLSNWVYTEVLEGLSAGDRILAALDIDGVGEDVSVTPESIVPKPESTTFK